MGGVRGHMAFGKAQILAVDSVILWRYVGMLLCPTDLCVLYDPASTGIALQVLLASAAWLIVAVAVVRSRKTYPLVTFATVTSVVFLLPVLNLFPITTLMNDRYLYLPSIPFFAIVTGGMSFLAHRIRRHGEHIGSSIAWIPASARQFFRASLMYSVSLTAIVVASQLTAAHLPVWSNGMALWKHAYRHVGELPVVRIQLANSLHSEGRDAEAVRVLKSTMAHCSPDVADRERIARKLDDWQQ